LFSHKRKGIHAYWHSRTAVESIPEKESASGTANRPVVDSQIDTQDQKHIWNPREMLKDCGLQQYGAHTAEQQERQRSFVFLTGYVTLSRAQR
jgi:hypothetical protein